MHLRLRPLLKNRDIARRIAGTALAFAVAAVAVVGAFHDHGLPGLGGRTIGSATAASETGLRYHDCLACKIAPPQATPFESVRGLDQDLGSGVAQATRDIETYESAPARLTPPRGPPLSPPV
jgi:hypothetical protein